MRTGNRIRILWVGVLAVVGAGLLAPSGLSAKEPIVSLRYVFNGGGELEVHMAKLGLLVGIAPGNEKREVKSGSTVVCEASYDTTYVGARYFFKGPRDSFYLGALQTHHALTSTNSCGQGDPASGVDLVVGYHWLWESGFNLDLGFRPGVLAIGYSF